MKRKEENRSVIEPSCTFFKPNKINVLPSNWKLTAVIMGFGEEHPTTNIRNITQNNHNVQYKTI
jgi:hypothetical protein